MGPDGILTERPLAIYRERTFEEGEGEGWTRTWHSLKDRLAGTDTTGGESGSGGWRRWQATPAIMAAVTTDVGTSCSSSGPWVAPEAFPVRFSSGEGRRSGGATCGPASSSSWPRGPSTDTR